MEGALYRVGRLFSVPNNGISKGMNRLGIVVGGLVFVVGALFAIAAGNDSGGGASLFLVVLLITLAASICAYLAFRVLGWIIRGFAG